jgi:hypothetical protein
MSDMLEEIRRKGERPIMVDRGSVFEAFIENDSNVA